MDAPLSSPVMVALTFDVEYDLGSSAKEAALSAVEPFLQQLPALAKDLGAVFTLFIQGNLVEGLAGYLQQLQAEHEIGLHGYSHELWGKVKWFLSHPAISRHTKEELLKQSIKCFTGSDLTPPVSFRAPDLVVDRDTMRLLENHGFRVDSSAPSYCGVPPTPDRPLGVGSKLLSIPITVSPFPRFQTRYLVPFTSYEVFNMARLATMSDDYFLSYIGEVLAFQAGTGVSPHLVFLAHSWEFKEWPDNSKLGYCSGDNYEMLSRKLSVLGEKYPLRYVAMKELARYMGVE